MTDISDDQIDQLLRQAEKRLRNDTSSAHSVPAADGGVSKAVSASASTPTTTVQKQPSGSKTDLSVREPPQPRTGQKGQAKVSICSFLSISIPSSDDNTAFRHLDMGQYPFWITGP